MALTTVGNGDKAPSTHVGKVIIDVTPQIQFGFLCLSNHQDQDLEVLVVFL